MSGGHKHRYKNAGLSADELRRRREEEGVQLRKQKREQQLFKRRNVNLPTANAPDITLQVHCIKCYFMNMFIIWSHMYPIHVLMFVISGRYQHLTN